VSKTKPLVIIDGCNAINLMKAFDQTQIRGFQASCDKLISIVQNFSYQSARKYIIVFDGYNPNGRNQNFGENVSVVFSGKKIADLVIEKMTSERYAKTIEVVSSDNEIANICRNHGARVMKVKEFEEQLEFFNERMNAHFIKEKGGKVREAENTLGETIDGGSLKKLNDLSSKIKKDEEANARRKEEAEKAKRKAAAKTVIIKDDAELFTSMFSDARRIKSKKYGDEDQNEDCGNKIIKCGRKSDGLKDENSHGGHRGAKDKNFDWTEHIDESFNNHRIKR